MMKMKYNALLAAVSCETLAAGTLVEEKTILAGKVTVVAIIETEEKE